MQVCISISLTALLFGAILRTTESEKMQKMYCKPIEILNYAGYEAYLVGGCVRDFVMGRDISDIDITTNALPEEIQRVFSDYRTLDIGIKHGTITVLIDDEKYEITTYRAETDYIDHRHPGKVQFGVSLKDDLSRRDFTVNAMAWQGSGDAVDPYGGLCDIEDKIIRCVGEPLCRFDEDALRILRALRFSATLGFEIEECTSRAAFSMAHLLRSVSAERIYTEWKKLLSGMYSYDVIEKYKVIISDYRLSLYNKTKNCWRRIKNEQRIITYWCQKRRFLLHASTLGGRYGKRPNLLGKQSYQR